MEQFGDRVRHAKAKQPGSGATTQSGTDCRDTVSAVGSWPSRPAGAGPEPIRVVRNGLLAVDRRRWIACAAARHSPATRAVVDEPPGASVIRALARYR